MDFWSVTLTYLTGVIGGIAFTLFLYLGDKRCLWVIAATLALGMFARWINRKHLC